MVFQVALTAGAALLHGCNDTTITSSTCDYVGGFVVCVGQGAGCSNTSLAADTNMATFGENFTTVGGSSLSATGKQFPGGTGAGAFMTSFPELSAADVTLNTFLMGAPIDSATGPTLTLTPTGPDTAATTYVSLETSAPFDQVQIVVNAADTDYLVYEFCGAATVR